MTGPSPEILSLPSPPCRSSSPPRPLWPMPEASPRRSSPPPPSRRSAPPRTFRPHKVLAGYTVACGAAGQGVVAAAGLAAHFVGVAEQGVLAVVAAERVIAANGRPRIKSASPLSSSKGTLPIGRYWPPRPVSAIATASPNAVVMLEICLADCHLRSGIQPLIVPHARAASFSTEDSGSLRQGGGRRWACCGCEEAASAKRGRSRPPRISWEAENKMAAIMALPPACRSDRRHNEKGRAAARPRCP